MSDVTWNGADADWTDASDWSTDSPPGIADTAIIDAGTVTISTAIHVGSITLGSNLTVDDSGLTVTVTSSLTNSGNLTLKSVGGSPGSTLDVGGNLSNSHNLNIDTASGQGGSQLNVTGTLVNTSSIDIGNSAGTLSASTTVIVGHLDNQYDLFIGGGTGSDSAYIASLIDKGDTAPSTLQSYITLSGSALLQFAKGGIANIDGSLILAGPTAAIVDAGASAKNALTGLQGNSGEFALTDGASLTINSHSFTNTSDMYVVNGSSLATGADDSFVNNGHLTLDYFDLTTTVPNDNGGGTMTVGGSLTNTNSIDIDLFDRGGGLTVAVTLINSGTLDIGNIETSTTVTTGHLTNTSIIELNGNVEENSVATTLVVKSGDAPTVLALGVSLSLSGNSSLQYEAGEIKTIAEGASLTLEGADARISDAAAPSANGALAGFANNAGTLELIDGASIPNASVKFTNSGILTIEDGTTVSTNAGISFTNSGTVNVSGEFYYSTSGSALSVGGALTNSGILNVVDPNPTESAQISAHNLVNSGTLNISGWDGGGLASILALNNVAPMELKAGVSINLSGDALLEYKSGGIETIALGAQLSLNGASALVANEAAPSAESALTGLSDNAGTLSLANGAALTLNSGANFTNSANLDLNTAGGAAAGSAFTITGTLTNSGAVNIGDDLSPTNFENLLGSTSVTTNSLNDTGAINLYSSIGSSFQALFDDLQGAAPSSLSSGTSFNLVGNALLEFNTGAITTIGSGAQITLVGTQAFIADSSATTSSSALQGLNDNAGTLGLADGASIAPSLASFTNSGQLDLDTGQNEGGTVFDVAGALTTSGTIAVGNNAVELTASTSITVSHLVNTGTINLESQHGDFSDNATYAAILQDTGDAVPTTLVAGVAIELLGNATLEYASGAVTTIASGASVSLNGAQTQFDTAANPTGNTVLDSLSSNAGTFTLDNGADVNNGSNALGNKGTMNIESDDADSNTTLTIGGILSNSATINITNTNDEAYTNCSIQVKSVTNSGAINVSQGQEGGGAGLSATGTITNTGTIDMSGTNPFISATGDYIQTSGETVMNGGYFTASEIELKGGLFQSSGSITGNVIVEGATFEASTTSPLDRVIIQGGVTVDSGSTIGVTLADSAVNTTNDIAIDGRLTLNGGILEINIPNPAGLTVGEQFLSIEANQNEIKGAFTALQYGSTVGSATSVDIGNGLAIDITYNNARGEIVLTVAASSDARHVALADLAAADGFHFSSAVMGALSQVSGMVAPVSGAYFPDLAHYTDAENLAAHHALMFTQTGGLHPGATYLVIDTNGEAGYQAGQDLVVKLDSQEVSAFSHFG
jgi:hypothetical protein